MRNFYGWDNQLIRYTGRWGHDPMLGRKKTKDTCTTGAAFEFAFKGTMAVMHFDIEFNLAQKIHLWISTDGGAMHEAPLARYLRIACEDEGPHYVKVIFKSTVEVQHRWYTPLNGRIAFMGFEADEICELAPDNRKTIEFIGDSITQGNLVETGYLTYEGNRSDQVYNDDVTATYAWLTAKELGLRPIIMGYGCCGVINGGAGAVPRAADAYPYNFDRSPIDFEPADYVVINHGANDAGGTLEDYLKGYKDLITAIRKINKKAIIFCLSAFCGAHHDGLCEFINSEYSEEDKVVFISSKGWVPLEPLHPLRAGHKTIAGHLVPILKEYMK